MNTLARILVTGHLGYIGTHAVDVLMKAGHKVRGIDIDLYEGCDFYTVPQPHESLIKDILEVEPSDFEDIDAVIHLAGLSNDPLGELDHELTRRVNHQGTVRLAECAKAAGVPRFIFSSSCSIYGKSGDAILTEEDESVPVTTYGETKIQSEGVLFEMADDSFSPVSLRNATAYGSSPRLRLDLVLNNLLAWGYATGEIRVISDGSPWRPLVHCRDIARGMAMIAEAPRDLIHNQIFNFGRSDENYRVRELVDIVKETVKDCTVVYTGEGSPDSRDYRVSFEKFERTFPDFKFLHTVRSGAAELHEDYKRFGMTKEIIEGPLYIRLKALTARLDKLERVNP